MAHEIDSTAGRYSFANARADHWHRVGQTVGHTMTAREALDAAHLANWNVRKMPLHVQQAPINTDDGAAPPPPLAVPDFYATVRDNPVTKGQIDVLGVVGSKYVPVANEASCGLLDALVDEAGGAHFETAGALRGGREVFVTLKLPNTMVFNGIDGSSDTTEFYIAALNSHDGSSAFRLIVTPVRIVCANTQTAAISRAKASFSIRHTGGAHESIAEARNALRLTRRYIEEFESQAAALYDQEMDTDQVREFAKRLLEVDDAPSAAAAKNRQDKVNGIVKLWVSSPTVAPLVGTKWGAYNAVTEYFDHVVPVRGARTSHAASESRAIRNISTAASATSVKALAFRMLQTI